MSADDIDHSRDRQISIGDPQQLIYACFEKAIITDRQVENLAERLAIVESKVSTHISEDDFVITRNKVERLNIIADATRRLTWVCILLVSAVITSHMEILNFDGDVWFPWFKKFTNVDLADTSTIIFVVAAFFKLIGIEGLERLLSMISGIKDEDKKK